MNTPHDPLADWPAGVRNDIAHAIGALEDADACQLDGQEILPGITIVNGRSFCDRLANRLLHGGGSRAGRAAIHLYNRVAETIQIKAPHE